MWPTTVDLLSRVSEAASTPKHCHENAVFSIHFQQDPLQLEVLLTDSLLRCLKLNWAKLLGYLGTCHGMAGDHVSGDLTSTQHRTTRQHIMGCVMLIIWDPLPHNQRTTLPAFDTVADLVRMQPECEWQLSSVAAIFFSSLSYIDSPDGEAGPEGAEPFGSILPWGFCAAGGLGEVQDWGLGLMAGLSWHGLVAGPFFTSRGEHGKSTGPHWYCRGEAGRSGVGERKERQ